ncbi:MAG TPA: GNAT family N-acetyltransferase [Candidatus Dormibacteraeota bacterium]|jgi:ribosomal protein S18 acetylase RimI-like enzyme
MEEWRRAIAFMRALDQRCAEEVVPVPWGRALINRTLSSHPDLNYLIADALTGDVDARTLASSAEQIQGSAGLTFRRVNVDDQPAAERLLAGFTDLQFAAERSCVMVRHRAPDRTVDPAGVEEIDWERYRPTRELAIRREWWAATERIVQQALAKQELTRRHLNIRYFAAIVDGRPVSVCELRREGQTAQIEFVETLEEYRRRGLARQVVGAALMAAREARFVFLVADLFDWPQHFYERLGFDTIGIETRFMRHLSG